MTEPLFMWVSLRNSHTQGDQTRNNQLSLQNHKNVGQGLVHGHTWQMNDIIQHIFLASLFLPSAESMDVITVVNFRDSLTVWRSEFTLTASHSSLPSYLQ